MKLNIKDLRISSAAFVPLARIPDLYTSKGENISPPIDWTGVPPNTQQLALICYDPDAPLARGFSHWLIYNIPAQVNAIAPGSGRAFTEGKNSMESMGYTGPAPPPGHGLHHYYFWLYALDTALDLAAGLDREQLLDAIAPHIIEQARTVGTYEL
ncbi:YbhB/YbcL family Raf kinase inhibitor-like protein [Chamaesiphon sp. VAR_69_metabat_338]|uniref:YbhB/YbcL family Raf kinase inhibitor-like protein n=1 Tax=Chamaesiphon sp. VAR_69_metabat_338 TaxID=2964704 RepID=UPI00286D9DB6|nr:YbhB/YbcL family Raf kinase inhibitor-like protein [Chamaesiphon sp. VAR_69_metabat_338]